MFSSAYTYYKTLLQQRKYQIIFGGATMLVLIFGYRYLRRRPGAFASSSAGALWAEIVLHFCFSILFGLFIISGVDRYHQAKAKNTGGILVTLGALLFTGCPFCKLAFLGITASSLGFLGVLPRKGFEFKILSLLLLFFVVLRGTKTKACCDGGSCCNDDQKTKKPCCTGGKKHKVILESTLICPHCSHQWTVTMPLSSCEIMKPCPACNTMLQAKKGDCCVYCSYGDIPCPSIQEKEGCCC